MYTNIRTEAAITHITDLLHQEAGKQFHHYDTEALTEAMKIVFRNNLIKFGDTYWRQTSGTGMGIAPAPPWATIYFAIHENKILPKWTNHIHFYRRFIDDIIGIWLCDSCPETNNHLWTNFKHDMQQWYGLEWDFSTLSSSCNYMDLQLKIHDRKIQSTLYEKQQNLYLYIPPHSAHPKSMLTGLIYGNILRIHRLCSTQHEIKIHTTAFYRRLHNRGYNSKTLQKFFHKATLNAQAYLNASTIDHDKRHHEKSTKTKRTVFFHLKYHPQDPPARDIQHIWEHTVTKPQGQPNINTMKNYDGANTPIDSLTVAYSRPLNLRNQFSVRNIQNRGQAVSSFL
jgi:hypothetical protein